MYRVSRPRAFLCVLRALCGSHRFILRERADDGEGRERQRAEGGQGDRRKGGEAAGGGATTLGEIERWWRGRARSGGRRWPRDRAPPHGGRASRRAARPPPRHWRAGAAMPGDRGFPGHPAHKITRGGFRHADADDAIACLPASGPESLRRDEAEHGDTDARSERRYIFLGAAGDVSGSRPAATASSRTPARIAMPVGSRSTESRSAMRIGVAPQASSSARGTRAAKRPRV